MREFPGTCWPLMSFDIDVLILDGIMESAVNELTGIIITGIADGNNSKESEGGGTT